MKAFALFFVGRVAVIAASQVGVIPDDYLGLLLQMPLVFLVVWLQLQNQKWFERMLGLHDESIKEVYAKNQEVYAKNQDFVNALLGIMERRQTKMADAISLLEKQVGLFRVSLSEVTGLDDFVDRIMEKIGR